MGSPRNLSAIAALAQLVAALVIFAGLFLGDDSSEPLILAAVAAVALLEVAEWMLARGVLRGTDPSTVAAAYEHAPLSAAERQLVGFNLGLSMAIPAILVAMVPLGAFADEPGVAAACLVVAVAPSVMSLWRVRQTNSWRAISRVPPTPSP